MPEQDVSVVIVSYNSRGYLGECLDRVVRDGRDVVVVDNGSTDGSAQFVSERYPGVRVRALAENVGFGRANNEGIESTSSQHVLLLNPDAWPVGDAVERLVQYVDEHPDIGIAGPKLINPNGTLQRSINGRPTLLWRGKPAIPGRAAPRRKSRLVKLAFRIRWIARRRPRRTAGAAAPPRRMILTRQFLKGAVLLVRRQAFDAVGGFDPDFFLFSEEVDLCQRVRAAGWTVEYVPDVSFVHLAASSTQLDWLTSYREQLRSHLRLISKHDGPMRAEVARRFLVVALHVRALLHGREGKVYAEVARWLASSNLRTLLGADAHGKR